MSISNDKRLAKRRTLGLLSAAAVGAVAAALPAFACAQAKGVLRIGYQKYGALTILKGRGTLEKRLAAQGIDVKWTEFPAGPVLLEGLNVGSIDFGTVGEAPPIFAQAAGANLVYVANEPAAPLSEGILVPKSSPLKTVADLKGKKVVLNKGSNVHYLLVRALEKAGLAYKDVETVFLPPADARAAFERGSVDAWVIWDPYWAAVEKGLAPRVLTTSRGLVSNHSYYLAGRAFAERHPEVLQVLFEELTKSDEFVRQHPKDAARIVAESTGIELPTIELYLARRPRSPVVYLTAAMSDEQQVIADSFFKQNLIPRQIRVKDVFWQPAAPVVKPQSGSLVPQLVAPQPSASRSKIN